MLMLQLAGCSLVTALFIACVFLVEEGAVRLMYVITIRAPSRTWVTSIHLELVRVGCRFCACVCLFWRNTFSCHFCAPASLLSTRTLVTAFDLVPVTAGCGFDACTCLFWRNSLSCQFRAAVLLFSRRMLVRCFPLMLVRAGCCFGVWVPLCWSNSFSYALGGYSSLQRGVAVLREYNWATWVTRFVTGDHLTTSTMYHHTVPHS
jgi:hypothetical protein